MTSDGTASGGFIYGSPDVGGSAIECSLVDQDCPKGEKCSPWANDGSDDYNATKCVPLEPDPDGAGDPCVAEGTFVSGVNSCALGATCLGDVEASSVDGICFALCTVDPRIGPLLCDDPELDCLPHHGGVFEVCAQPCECEEGLVCVVGNDGQSQCAPAR